MSQSSAQSNQKDQVVKSMITVQIINYHCANCGEEIEEVKLCNSCKAPMRVIQVTEKYGAEAEKYLEDLKKLPNTIITTDSNVANFVANTGVENALAGEEEYSSMDEIDAGYTPIKQRSEEDIMSEFASLDDGIFSSDEEDGINPPVRKDLTDLLNELDKEEPEVDGSVDFGGDDLDSFKDL
jgi:hypothetical protein